MTDPDELSRRRLARRDDERRRRIALRRRAAVAVVIVVGIGAVILARGGPEENRSDAENAAVSQVPERTAASKRQGRTADPPAAVNAKPISPSKAPVPILMYHVIGSPPADSPYPDLWVNPGVLSKQMDWLADRGYSGVTLDQVYRAWNDGGKLPARPVVISFDDGLRSQYTEAFPILRKLGWPGVLNLKLDALTQGELATSEVKEMIEGGWEIGSHTITHADLSTISGSALDQEVAGSRRQLQKRFDVPVNFFCFPAGAYDAEAVEAVKRAGYLGATTTELGLADRADPYLLKRVRINRSTGVSGLAELLGTLGS